jgi:hypothetical protein
MLKLSHVRNTATQKFVLLEPYNKLNKTKPTMVHTIRGVLVIR